MTVMDLGKKLVAGAVVSAAVFVGAAAAADDIKLAKPMQAASLHEGEVDMVVYYLDQDDHFEVVGTYVPFGASDEPARIRMGLADGDAVSFSMPGLTQVKYSFSRKGDTVSVSADPTGMGIDVTGNFVETADLKD